MTRNASESSALAVPGEPCAAIRVPTDARRAAAARLIGEPEQSAAPDRFITAARSQNIDLEHMWAVPRDGAGWKQVVLAVPSPGRTAMIFLSKPGPSQALGDESEQRADRVACLRAAARGLADLPEPPALIQATPETSELWALRTYQDAGWKSVGTLRYMRATIERTLRAASGEGRAGLTRPTSARPGEAGSRLPPGPSEGAVTLDPGGWPDGITVRRVESIDHDRPDLAKALEASYVDTLDCPEMCGLRRTKDVIASHAATGTFDAALWWLLYRRGEPAGCCLLTRVPELSCLELVYLGIGPAARGLGLGRRLLAFALRQADLSSLREVVLAVDERNAPAVRVYRSLGFTPTVRKVAYVHVLGS